MNSEWKMRPSRVLRKIRVGEIAFCTKMNLADSGSLFETQRTAAAEPGTGIRPEPPALPVAGNIPGLGGLRTGIYTRFQGGHRYDSEKTN